jgi:hypothetical protein
MTTNFSKETGGKEDSKPSPTESFELEKNDNARLRVSRSIYRGREFIDVSTFVKNFDTGEFVPTKKGITFSPEQLPKFISGLQRIQSGGVE